MARWLTVSSDRAIFRDDHCHERVLFNGQIVKAVDLRKLPKNKNSCTGRVARPGLAAQYESDFVKKFTELGLAGPVLNAVSAEGYTTPTPIQGKVIPAMLAGRDIMGVAQTGTGKTAAFVLPLLHRIIDQPRKPGPRRCGALILAPTRELAAQINESIRAYGKFIRYTSLVIIGGVKAGPQIKAMSHGRDIVVATPGRLLDLMSSGAVCLDQTRVIILDEGDQMLDLGFMPAIRRILAKLPRDRQTLLLSATMPKQIQKLAQDFLNDPLRITVGEAARPIDKIEQKVISVNQAAKCGTLIKLLAESDLERAIVFTRTKRGADRVNRQLEKAKFSSAAIHGNKTQSQRQKTLAGFRHGKISILVATDIAARGIDIDDVSHVINYDLPHVPEAYIHRIGRTARAGKSGIAISLCDSSERGLLRDIERLIGRSLTAKGTEGAKHVRTEGESKISNPEPVEGERDHNKKAHNGFARPHKYARRNATGKRARRGKGKFGNKVINIELASRRKKNARTQQTGERKAVNG